MDTPLTNETSIISLNNHQDGQETPDLGRFISLGTYSNIEITKNIFSIGRSENSDFGLQNGVISQNHALLEYDFEDKSLYITDLSTNGTFLNDRLIGKNQKVLLCNGDQVSFTDFFKYNYVKVDRLQVKLFLKKYVFQNRIYSDSKVKINLSKIGDYLVAIKENLTKLTFGGNEIRIYKNLSKLKNYSPYVVKYHDSLITNTKTYLIIEYAKSGTLFDYIVKNGKLTEKQSKKVINNLVQGLKFLRNNGIVHGDLKPENIFLGETLYDVKLGDFETSCEIGKSFKINSVSSMIGTPIYLSPEVFNAEYIYKTSRDIWALGVILYISLSGRMPFDDLKSESLISQISNGSYSLSSSIFPKTDENALDLIKKMLTVNPEERIQLDEILEHSWFEDPEKNRYESISLETIKLFQRTAITSTLGRRTKTRKTLSRLSPKKGNFKLLKGVQLESLETYTESELKKKTVKELRKIAKILGKKGYSRLRKADLVNFII